jgi:hypothetical protein
MHSREVSDLLTVIAVAEVALTRLEQIITLVESLGDGPDPERMAA